jgi:hypothetical protein
LSSRANSHSHTSPTDSWRYGSPSDTLHPQSYKCSSQDYTPALRSLPYPHCKQQSSTLSYILHFLACAPSLYVSYSPLRTLRSPLHPTRIRPNYTQLRIASSLVECRCSLSPHRQNSSHWRLSSHLQEMSRTRTPRACTVSHKRYPLPSPVDRKDKLKPLS